MAGISGQPTPKPSDLPAPSGSPYSELDAVATPPPKDNYAELDALAASAVNPPPQTEAPQSIGGQVLDAAGRVLDYPGGHIRTALATAAGLVTGNPNVTTDEDVKAAMKGKAPGMAEYLRRLGVSEGGSMNLPGLGRVTLRGAEGLALDIATDPLTALAKMTKEIPYLSKILNAPGKGTEALGEAVYKSAVSGAEAKLAAKGKIKSGATPIGDALVENGAPIGGLSALEQKVNDISQTMGKTRQALYDKATELGVTIDPSYPLKRAEGVLKDMMNYPPLRGAADELQTMLESYKQAGPVSLDMMSKWKTQLYDSLPAKAFGQYGKLNSFGKQFKAALAADFRAGIVEAGNAAEKGLGDAIDKLNGKWGALLDATSTGAMAPKGASLGHQIDGAILATGGLKAAALKKGYDLATSPYARTAVGKALMTAGRSNLTNSLARQAVVESARPPQPPDVEPEPQ